MYYIKTRIQLTAGGVKLSLQGPFNSAPEVQEALAKRYDKDWADDHTYLLFTGKEVATPREGSSVELLKSIDTSAPIKTPSVEIRQVRNDSLEFAIRVLQSGVGDTVEDVIANAAKIEQHLLSDRMTVSHPSTPWDKAIEVAKQVWAETPMAEAGPPHLYHGKFCNVNSQGEHGTWCFGNDTIPGRAGGLED